MKKGWLSELSAKGTRKFVSTYNVEHKRPMINLFSVSRVRYWYELVFTFCIIGWKPIGDKIACIIG